MIEKDVLGKNYQLTERYTNLTLESKNMLDMVMSILNCAHVLDTHHNLSGRDLLETFSPDNDLLKHDEYITWGNAVFSLITDVLNDKDLQSQSANAGRKH